VLASSSRPRLPDRPCPVCGVPVEPLRAAEVVLVDAGFRYLCSAKCRADYVASLDGARSEAPAEERPRSASASWSSGSDAGTRSTRRKRARIGSGEWTGARLAQPPAPPTPPTLALGLAAASLLASVFATSWTLASIASILALASAAVALVLGGHVRLSAGVAAYLAAPLGTVLACAAGLVRLTNGEDARWFLAGAALAAALANARWWLDATSALSVEQLVRSLAARMPARAHVPAGVEGKPLAVAAADVEASRVRVGEEILVSEGETVCVDGSVRAGQGYALLHPSATAPVRRSAGDSVIAGARVVEGAIRVLATHVGSDRALLRPARFGDGSAADAATLTRVALRAEVIATGVLAVGVLLALTIAHAGDSLAARLGAAASVFLAAPLLALRRAADTPFVVAGAAAAERGITFASARALDRAGRTTVAVLSVRGTLTEGAPEVVETHAFEGADLDGAIALAASAEAGIEGSTIAHALIRHAEERGIPLVPVRRVSYVAGRGVRATAPSGESIVIGTRQFLLEDGATIAIAEADAARAEARGHLALFVAVDRRVRALISLRDEERPGARAAVQRLIDLDVEVVLLSGDPRGTVDAIAKGLDVHHVRADLTPEERGAEVRRLRDAGGVVASVAHPGHDTEVLAASDVPVVLAAAGGSEGDRAIALTGEDVRDAAGALWIAHAARREATRATAVAAIGGVALIALGAFGIASPAFIAALAICVDGFVLPTGARVLRRIELRLPARG
jgi:Cu+-exporting ATPase